MPHSDCHGQSQAEQWFQSMNRLRRAWQTVTPCALLNKSQFATLMVLRHGGLPPHAPPVRPANGCMTLSALAAMMGQSLPALSKRIHTLEAMGYVERVPDPTDRRVAGVRLTAAGEQLLEQARAHMEQTLNAALHRMGQADTARLLALMEQMTTALEAVQKCPVPPAQAKHPEHKEEQEESC